MKITVSKQFQDLIFPLTEQEMTSLENSILQHGVKDPLTVWDKNGKSILVDGHHRYSIIQKHKITKYKINKMQFDSKTDAINFILDFQMARRNCTPEGISYLRGLRYKNEKRSHGGDRKSTRNNFELKNTSETLGEQYKVTGRTIVNDEKFTDAVDSILSIFPSKEKTRIKAKLLSRKLTLSKKDILELSTLPVNQIRDVTKGKKELWESRAEANKIAKNRRLQKAAKLSLPKDMKLYVGDCMDLSKKHLKDDSIQCIISDPPYSKDALECFDKLGRIAKRVLEPSGFCCFYSGKLHLDRVFEIMGTYLNYYWQIILLHHGKIGTGFNPVVVQARKVDTFYKSILIFQKPPIKSDQRQSFLPSGDN